MIFALDKLWINRKSWVEGDKENFFNFLIPLVFQPNVIFDLLQKCEAFDEAKI